jgi:hypothetical protein
MVSMVASPVSIYAISCLNLAHVFINIARIEKNFNQNCEKIRILDRRCKSKDERAAALRNLTHVFVNIARIEKNFNQNCEKIRILDRYCESNAIARVRSIPPTSGATGRGARGW